MVSQSWKSLSEGERAPWIEMGRVDRERYEREKASYKGPWKIPDVKDPDAPKKPMSAFLAFSNERRKIVARANPNMSGTQISSLMSKLWRECPEHMKQSYRDQEAREREIFKQAFAVWERKKDAELVAGCHGVSDSSGQSTKNSEPVALVQSFDEQHQSTPSSLLEEVERELLSFDSAEAIQSSTAAGGSTADMLMDNMKIGVCPPTTSANSFPCPTLSPGHNARTVSRESFGNFVSEEAWPFNQAPKTITLPSASRYENYTLEDILQDDDFAPRPIAPAMACDGNTPAAAEPVQLPSLASCSSLFTW